MDGDGTVTCVKGNDERGTLPYAEEMATTKPDRLKCDRSTDKAGIVVNGWYDGQKNLADGLHEKSW